MKKTENVKQIVFIVGFIALLVGVFGAIANKSLVEYFFPIYTGLTLMGTTLLHKEELSKELIK